MIRGFDWPVGVIFVLVVVDRYDRAFKERDSLFLFRRIKVSGHGTKEIFLALIPIELLLRNVPRGTAPLRNVQPFHRADDGAFILVRNHIRRRGC